MVKASGHSIYMKKRKTKKKKQNKTKQRKTKNILALNDDR